MAGDGPAERAWQPEKHCRSLPAVSRHHFAGLDSLQDAANSTAGIVGVSSHDYPPVRPFELPVLHGNGPRNDDGRWGTVDGFRRRRRRSKRPRRRHRSDEEFRQRRPRAETKDEVIFGQRAKPPVTSAFLECSIRTRSTHILWWSSPESGGQRALQIADDQ